MFIKGLLSITTNKAIIKPAAYPPKKSLIVMFQFRQVSLLHFNKKCTFSHIIPYATTVSSAKYWIHNASEWAEGGRAHGLKDPPNFFFFFFFYPVRVTVRRFSLEFRLVSFQI